MYYIWSLIISIIIFLAIQYNEYEKNKSKYNLYSLSNIGTFMIIFVVLTIILYMTSNNYIFETTSKEINSTSNNIIDPNMLKKIPEPIYTGFTPYHHND